LIVVDASAVVCLLAGRPQGKVSALRQRIRGQRLHAPHLLDLEVTHVIRRLLLRGELALERAEAALADLAELQLTRHPHYPHLVRIWELRSNLTAYDAAYVALADFLDSPLLTLDARLVGAGAAAKIEVF
jgi:predicted nucleic acid-binding protein